MQYAASNLPPARLLAAASRLVINAANEWQISLGVAAPRFHRYACLSRRAGPSLLQAIEGLLITALLARDRGRRACTL